MVFDRPIRTPPASRSVMTDNNKPKGKQMKQYFNMIREIWADHISAETATPLGKAHELASYCRCMADAEEQGRRETTSPTSQLIYDARAHAYRHMAFEIETAFGIEHVTTSEYAKDIWAQQDFAPF